jgi:type IV pilus assembly protein PilP
MMQKFFLSIMFSLMVVSAGCSSDREFSDLRFQMDEARSKPGRRIEPVPKPKPYQPFSYSASVLRAPFSPLVEIKAKNTGNNVAAVAPDFDRRPQVLEDFSFDSLVMVGSINRPGDRLYVLIKDPEGGLHRVTAGQQKASYMGRNHGKIVGVSRQQLDVIEIVPDGNDGWVERPRIMVLEE